MDMTDARTLPPEYIPFPDGTFVPASPQQLQAFMPAYRARYASMANRADEVRRLEDAIKQTESDLAGAVEIERAVQDALNTVFKPPTFNDLWKSNRSHG
jgi:hypothetical protein